MCFSVRHMQIPSPGLMAWMGPQCQAMGGGRPPPEGLSSAVYKLQGRPFYRGEDEGVLNPCNAFSDVCMLYCVVVQEMWLRVGCVLG